MNKKLRYAISLALCSAWLSGCSSMRSEYESPQLDIPTHWTGQSELSDMPQSSFQELSGEGTDPLANDITQHKWWMLFEDEQLNKLVDQVLASNSELALATLTLKKARLAAGLSENNKIPSLGFSHSSSSEYDLEENNTDTSFSSSLSLSYELDLWGRVEAAADVDQWLAQASYQDRESTAQSLVVTAATLYWKLGYLNQMISLTEQNISGTERVAKVTQLKYASGGTTRLEVLESTQSLFNQKVQLSQLQQELLETQNALAILINQPLQDVALTIDQLSSKFVPEIEAGVPSDVLLRRPDIKASLYSLKSSLANQDAVSASYLPQVSLTGSLGTSSSYLLGILQNPVATLGSGISLPFLEWNEMKLNKNISEIDYEMAVINYRDTIYQAFEEVDNLLAIKASYRYQGEVYQEQYFNAKEIEAIYSSRYQYGASDMIDWINAMESRRSIESTLLENQFNQLVTQIKLYQSLGGAEIITKG
ncbi:TolC family protein [Vibrio sp. TH_r3]|uniref:TolC family protein n=1 Tax=Vibrio sp. TH_r3 TaxID=3082084 RepID=UPI00295435CF|nr:TolC family protein [Vibrio sp. TH_r3]MDV7103820.1 TolC family protein [Vibrio sp. TH_r3]